MGRDVQAGDPERAVASRMADACRTVDIDVARAAGARTIDDEPSPKVEAEARAVWRRRIDSERNRLAAPDTSPAASAPTAPPEPPRRT
jgi:hypothetical protein